MCKALYDDVIGCMIVPFHMYLVVDVLLCDIPGLKRDG
jgi:hypothetical protein